MSPFTAGIDIGSTYTKCVVVGETGEIEGRAMKPTGFRLAERRVFFGPDRNVVLLGRPRRGCA